MCVTNERTSDTCSAEEYLPRVPRLKSLRPWLRRRAYQSDGPHWQLSTGKLISQRAYVKSWVRIQGSLTLSYSLFRVDPRREACARKNPLAFSQKYKSLDGMNSLHLAGPSKSSDLLANLSPHGIVIRGVIMKNGDLS